jgi:hypothetical protein
MTLKSQTPDLTITLTFVGIGGLAIWGNNQFNELKNGFSKSETQVAVIEEQILAFKTDIQRFEKIRDEFLAIEKRINEQDQAIALSSENSIQSASAAKRVEQQLQGVSEELASLKKDLPEGVSVRDIGCIPLNKGVRVSGGKSYDFCNTNWTLQVSSINNIYLNTKSNQFLIPFTRKADNNIVPEGCTLEGLEIFKGKEGESKYVAEIRGRCNSN